MTWQEYLDENYAASTAMEYGREVGHYLVWLGGAAAALMADYATVVGYLAYLQAGGKARASRSRILAAVKTYHRYLLRTGRRGDHPAAHLRLRGGGPRWGRVQLQNLLDADELQSLLDAPAAVFGRMAGRAVPVLGLLVHQALCSREIAGLTVASLDLTAATVTVPESKRTAGRVLPLAGAQVMGLHHYLTELRPRRVSKLGVTDSLFLTQRGGVEAQNIALMVKCLRSVVDKPVTPLLIRQSVIAERLRRGGGLREVQTFAGHKRVSTTENYRENNLAELRQAVARFHPLATNE